MPMPRRSPQFYDEVTDSALAAYLKRIVRISLLPKERELELAKRIQEGDEKPLRELVEANLRFVVKVAMHYQGCGLSLLDLINEGNLGLLEAGRRFRPEYSVKFITYAVWWIRQAIMQALARGSGAM
ncbi:MAG: sigma-70 family RNA polymerase sigma factor, partial [candidate division NC10 bacterium]